MRCVPLYSFSLLRLGLVLALGAGLGACARDDGAGWHKAGVSPAQQGADSRACKRKADDYAMHRVHQPNRAIPNSGRDPWAGTDPLAQVDRAEARDLYRRAYADCMEDMGYLKGIGGGIGGSSGGDAPR